MADAPILLGLSGALFLLVNEGGGMVQSFERDTERTEILVYDASLGYDTGLVSHNPVASYTVEIISTGNTGIMAAAPGVAVTLANITTGNGVTSGGIYTTGTKLSHPGGQLQRMTITAKQRPGIN